MVKVSQASYDHTRPYWDQIGATIVGRHVFDMTDGWDGKPPGGVDHVVVVTHRQEPEGWDSEAPFHFVDGVEAAVAKAQELAGDRVVEVAAGDVGGQVLAAGLIDEVRMDVVPVVFGSGKRYFGSVDAQTREDLEDLVLKVRSHHQMTIVLITHDLGVVAETCEHVVVMREGNVVESGTCEAIFNRPRADYTQTLLAASRLVEGEAA